MRPWRWGWPRWLQSVHVWSRRPAVVLYSLPPQSCWVCGPKQEAEAHCRLQRNNMMPKVTWPVESADQWSNDGVTHQHWTPGQVHQGPDYFLENIRWWNSVLIDKHDIFHHLFQTPPTYKAGCIDGILQSVMEKSPSIIQTENRGWSIIICNCNSTPVQFVHTAVDLNLIILLLTCDSYLICSDKVNRCRSTCCRISSWWSPPPPLFSLLSGRNVLDCKTLCWYQSSQDICCLTTVSASGCPQLTHSWAPCGPGGRFDFRPAHTRLTLLHL